MRKVNCEKGSCLQVRDDQAESLVEGNKKVMTTGTVIVVTSIGATITTCEISGKHNVYLHRQGNVKKGEPPPKKNILTRSSNQQPDTN